MTNLLDVLLAKIPLYLQEYPLTPEERYKIQEKKTEGRDIREQFPSISEIQAKLREILQAFIQNAHLNFVHLHSQESPFGLRAVEFIKEKDPQSEGQNDSVGIYVVSKKTEGRIGSYKCVRLSVDLRTLKKVAKVQNRSQESICAIEKEFSHLQKLQTFAGFCKIIHPQVYQYIKTTPEMRRRNEVRATILIEWLETELFAVVERQISGDFRLDKKQIYFIIQQLLKYLIPCHEQGIVLRDIKLENVMIKKNEEEKNKEYSQYRPLFVDTEEVSFRKQKKVKGTLGYIAPEMLFQLFTRGAREKVLAEPSWDMWSFGWVAFYLYNSMQTADVGPFIESFRELDGRILNIERDCICSLETRARRVYQILNTELKQPLSPQNPIEQLILQLLCLDPQKRMTAKQALEFFQTYIGRF